MSQFIQDPTVTPRQLAFCYKEIEIKEEKLIKKKKVLHEQLLSLQHDIKTGALSETLADDYIKNAIEELRLKIKNIIMEHEGLVNEMNEIRNRMAALIPKEAQKRLDEIQKLESHIRTRKREELFHEFLSVVAKAFVIKENLYGRQGSNYNFEFKFNTLGDKDKKIFIDEIEKKHNELNKDNEHEEEKPSEFAKEKMELEEVVKGKPFAQVDKLLKEVGATGRKI